MPPRPINPDLQDVIEAYLARERLDLSTALPGRVERYDAATQTADVLPLLRHPVPQADGSTVWEDPPVVPCVPVIFPRTLGWFLAFALQPGDGVLLVALEGSAGAWRAGDGALQDAEDLRRHHLSNCVCLPGFFVRNKALAHAPEATSTPGRLASTDAALVLGSDDGSGPRITLRPNGSVEITQGATVVVRVDPDGTVHLGGAVGDFVALATRVDTELAALRAAITSAVIVPNDGGAALKAAMLTWSPTSVAATKAKAT